MVGKHSHQAHRKSVSVASLIMSPATRKRLGTVVGSSAALTMIAATSGAALNDQVNRSDAVDIAAVTEHAAHNVIKDMGVNDAVAASDVEWSTTGSTAQVETSAPVEVKVKVVSTVQRAAAQTSQQTYTTDVPNPPSSGVAGFAQSFLGTRYILGGSTPSGFDCSGFVGYVYSHTRGISLPRTADGIGAVGTRISPADAVPGDVLYWPGQTHVGIYAGNGMVIHASYSLGKVVYLPVHGSPVYIRF